MIPKTNPPSFEFSRRGVQRRPERPSSPTFDDDLDASYAQVIVRPNERLEEVVKDLEAKVERLKRRTRDLESEAHTSALRLDSALGDVEDATKKCVFLSRKCRDLTKKRRDAEERAREIEREFSSFRRETRESVRRSKHDLQVVVDDKRRLEEQLVRAESTIRRYSLKRALARQDDSFDAAYAPASSARREDSFLDVSAASLSDRREPNSDETTRSSSSLLVPREESDVVLELIAENERIRAEISKFDSTPTGSRSIQRRQLKNKWIRALSDNERALAAARSGP